MGRRSQERCRISYSMPLFLQAGVFQQGLVFKGLGVAGSESNLKVDCMYDQTSAVNPRRLNPEHGTISCSYAPHAPHTKSALEVSIRAAHHGYFLPAKLHKHGQEGCWPENLSLPISASCDRFRHATWRWLAADPCLGFSKHRLTVQRTRVCLCFPKTIATLSLVQQPWDGFLADVLLKIWRHKLFHLTPGHVGRGEMGSIP